MNTKSEGAGFGVKIENGSRLLAILVALVMALIAVSAMASMSSADDTGTDASGDGSASADQSYAITVSIDGTETGYNDMRTAINAVNSASGSSMIITLNENVKVSANDTGASATYVNVTKNSTWNLNGMTLTFEDYSGQDYDLALLVSGDAKLTIDDSSTGKTGKIVFDGAEFVQINGGGTLIVQSGTIESAHKGDYVILFTLWGTTTSGINNSNLVLGSGAVLVVPDDYTGFAYGVNIQPNSSTKKTYGVTVEVDGVTMKGNFGSSFYINGNAKHSDGNVANITIDSGTFIGDLYAAGYAVWNINGGTFTSGTPLSLKSGTFYISGGEFNATGTFRTRLMRTTTDPNRPVLP